MAGVRHGLVAVAVLGATLIGSPLLAGPATSQQPASVFACRASAANLLGVEQLIANPADSPCSADAQGIGSFPPGPGGAQALSAITQVSANGGGVVARTTVMGIAVPLLGETVGVGLIQSEAAVTCDSGQARFSGTSTVHGLTVAGQHLADTEPRDIWLGIGVLHLNYKLVAGNTLTVRPVWLETAIGNVILGEARAGFNGAPCGEGITQVITDPLPSSITIVKDADPARGERFSFDGELGSFSLQDGDRRTFFVPPRTYRITERPVTAGQFVASWELIAATCSDGQATVNRTTRRVEIHLDPGENLVCTISNQNEPYRSALAAGALEGAGETGPDPERRQLTPVGADSTTSGGGAAGKGKATPPTAIKTQNSGLSGAVVPLVGLPLLLGLGALLWFLLAAGRRRRDEGAG